MKKIILFSIVLLLQSGNLNAQNKSLFLKPQSNRYENQISIIVDAFKTKKIARLNKILVTGYTIKGLPKGIEPLALPQIFQQMPSFNKYEILSLKKEKENTRVVLLFKLKEEKINSNLLINKEGKIKELNLLEDADVN